MEKRGKRLEKFVRVVEEIYKSSENTKIFSNYKVELANKRKREIDIFIQSEVNGYVISIAIECKEYKRKVPVKDIESFQTKCTRIPHINKKVFVAENGYQTGAIEAAKELGIELLEFENFKNNYNSIFPKFYLCRPEFIKFELIEAYYEPTEYIGEIYSNQIKEFKDIRDVSRSYSLYELIQLATEHNWSLVNLQAINEYVSTENHKQEVLININLTGIYFEYDNHTIYLQKLIVNAHINILATEVPVENRLYLNTLTNDVKIKSIQLKETGVADGQFLINDKNEMYFYDEDKIEMGKMELLYTYDPEKKIMSFSK